MPVSISSPVGGNALICQRHRRPQCKVKRETNHTKSTWKFNNRKSTRSVYLNFPTHRGIREITTAEHAAGGELATTLPPAASQPQQIPPKSPSVGALYNPSKCPKTSPPKKSFLSSFVPNGAKKGFGFPTHRSSSVPSRTDVPDTKRPTPRSLPEERSLSVSSPKAVFYRISLQPRQKPLRVIILGQSGVGKTGKLNYLLFLIYVHQEARVDFTRPLTARVLLSH